MRVAGWAIGAAFVALAMTTGYLLRPTEDTTSNDTTPVAFVSAPAATTTTTRATALPDPAKSPSVAPGKQPRPAKALVERIATKDRAGGDIKMMTSVMATQPHAAAAQPFETLMTDVISHLPVFAATTNPVTVSCVRAACEVAGMLPPGQSAATMATVFRDKELERTLLMHGYTPGPLMVADAGAGQSGFVFYLANNM